MKITDLKINGIKNPVGFAFEKVKCSWQVENFTDKYQKNVKIEVALDEGFTNLCCSKEGENLSSLGEVLKIDLEPFTRYYCRVTVTGNNGETGVSETAYFETARMGQPWMADFIGMEEDDNFHPVFFKEFTADKPVKKARLYVSGLGLYEAYVNGKKAGEDFLAPFCNDYGMAVQYQTYDVTDAIAKENKIEIITGNGWYKGRLGYEGAVSYFGNTFAAIAELYIEYEDGTTDDIKTDGSWEYRGSDIEMSDIYDGEIYNHCLWDKKINVIKPVVIRNDIDKKLLVERYSIPVIVKEEIPVKEVIITPAGEKVLDMGQNFAGYMEFTADFPKGTKIVLDFGEVLQQGNFYNDNYRTAKSQFVYVSSGKKEVVRPHFTFFGFRYVRVTGWVGELKPESFSGKVVYSDLDRTGYIETSNEKINRLYENCVWGQKSNFVDMPTDCPQRDERLAWTGDAQVFAPTASYNMDTRAFYDKFLKDLRVEQQKWGGSIVNFIPNYTGQPGGSSVWGDVATFIPNTLYDFYKDEDALRSYYPLMKDWVDYITKQDEAQGTHHLFDFGFHFGDWLALDGVTPQSFKGGTDDYYIASVYYHASAKLVARAAGILGKKEEEAAYQKLADDIKQAIFGEYFTPSGRLAMDTQAAYLIALKFGVYMDKAKLMEGFAKRLEKDCYKIKCGFVGAPMLCTVLAENGMEQLAYEILFREEFPSWLYCVNLGATTIWERWNSILPDGTISGTNMNSLNHYSYGSVMEFVYRYIAGINPAEPGFTKVAFAPKINNKLQFIKTSYQSAAGTWCSQWKINSDGSITVGFEVPFNCTATVELPDYDGEVITLEPGSFELTYQPTKNYLSLYNWETRLEDYRKNPEAMEIMGRMLPIAAGMAASDDEENLSLCLGKMKYMFFLGFNPQAVEAAAEELFKLQVKY